MTEQKQIPLYVDVDGTLLKTDLLYESAIALLKKNIFYAVKFPIWLRKGKAQLKREIANRVDLNIELLPYNYTLIDYLVSEHQQGRTLVLASASDKLFVDKISEHLGIFESVIATDADINLTGKKKLGCIELDSQGEFAYAGNSKVDLEIWEHAAEAIVVDRSGNLEGKISKETKIALSINPYEKSVFKSSIKSLRPHQWVKNLLIFLPAIMGQELSLDILPQLLIAFFAFSFCASSVYILNDLVDLESDRQNQYKKNRPFASGNLPVPTGVVLGLLCFLLGFCAAFFTNENFLLTLITYYCITFGYSFWLKRIAVLDIMILASLYTIRVFAGSVASRVDISFWLLAFSMFMFLSLACTKRLSELYSLKKERKEKTEGRGYLTDDVTQVSEFGTVAGYLSVLVLALYINSEQVTRFYSRPEALWFLCPLMLYWISRILLIANRGQMHEDPIIFAITDRASHFVGLIGLLIIILSV